MNSSEEQEVHNVSANEIKQTARQPDEKVNSRREPLFSRSRLFVIVGGVIIVSLVFFRFICVLSEHDLQLPVAVISLSLATFVAGQFIRHRLHRSWLAWALVSVLIGGGYLAFQWHFGESRRETEVAEWIIGQGGTADYQGANFDSMDGYFRSEGDWWLPAWLADFTGKGYFAELNTIDFQGTRIGDEVIPQLAQVQHLNDLFLADSNVTAAGVAELPIIPGVSQVLLDWRQVSPESVAKLSQFSKLERLVIGYPAGVKSAQLLESMQARITDLAGLNQVKELTITYDGALNEDDAATLASLANLELLYVLPTDRDGVQELGPAGALMPLADAQNLQQLFLVPIYQDVSLEELEAFAGMPRIKLITIPRYGDGQQRFPFLPEQVQSIETKFPGVRIHVFPLSSGLPRGN